MLVEINNKYYEPSRIQKVDEPALFIRETNLSNGTYHLYKIKDDLSLQEDCGLTNVVIHFDDKCLNIDLNKVSYDISYGFMVYVEGKGLNRFNLNYQLLKGGFETMADAIAGREEFVKDVNEKCKK